MDKIRIKDVHELYLVAKKLDAFAQGIQFFTFDGEMGAGKTTFIKAFCHYLGVTETVSSPTFSIINQYQSTSSTIYHFDFYRLKTLQEAYDLGYEDYFYSHAICLIEWPGKVAGLLPPTYIAVHIYIEPDKTRTFTFDKKIK